MCKSHLIYVSCLLTWFLAETAARADSVHLPCDKPIAATVGTDGFIGKTGEISFTLIQPTYLRLETTFFRNCGGYNPKKHRHDVTRRWFGGLHLHGSITPEISSLGFEHKPVVARDKDGDIIYRLDENGDPLLDADGHKVPKTENTLTKAELSTGMDLSYGAGLQLSVYDGDHFHIEAGLEYTSSFGRNKAYADTVVARAIELNLDITDLVNQHAEIGYDWHMIQIAATIGVPMRPMTVARHQFTPYLTLGYMWFNADIDVSLDERVTHDLEALHVNVVEITKKRVISKRSPTASIGARLDFNKKASLEASAMFGHAGSTTAYVFNGSFTYHFDYPW